MKIIATSGFHLVPVRMTKVINTNAKGSWSGCGERTTLSLCWWECKVMQALWRFSKSLKIGPAHGPGIAFLCRYSKESKSYWRSDACLSIFIAAVFTDEWIIKMRYILHNGKLFSYKKSEIMNFTGKWIELEMVILNELCPDSERWHHMFSLICGC